MQIKFVVPHAITTDSATIWCMIYLPFGMKPLDKMFVVNVKHGGNNQGSYFLSGLKKIGNYQTVWDVYAQYIDLNKLAPGTEYDVLVALNGGSGHPRKTCNFETLPTSLPVGASGQGASRPFSVFAGSCFAYHHDNYRAGLTYAKLYDDKKLRPHVKFLMGDQVYLDQPVASFGMQRALLPRSSTRIKVLSDYIHSWERLDRMLARGGAYFLADDHEFWNDYPYTPLKLVWPAFSAPSFRKYWETVARKKFLEFQGGGASRTLSTGLLARTFSVGSDISFCVLDSRLGRSESRGRFTTNAAMSKFVRWAKGLSSPGVLVISQPLMTPAVSKANMIVAHPVSDRNLPFFSAQYRELLEALVRSKFPILVISGDVHFSRVAEAELKDIQGNKNRLVEIITSPMSLLTINSPPAGRWEIGVDTSPSKMPPVTLPGFVPTTISYTHAGQAKKNSAGAVSDPDRTAENAAHLSFYKNSSGDIRWKLRSYLLRRYANSGAKPVIDYEASGKL